MLGRSMSRLWRAAQMAKCAGTFSMPSPAIEIGVLDCIHLPAQQLTSLKSFSALASPHPSLIRDFAIIGATGMASFALRIDILPTWVIRGHCGKGIRGCCAE